MRYAIFIIIGLFCLTSLAVAQEDLDDFPVPKAFPELTDAEVELTDEFDRDTQDQIIKRLRKTRPVEGREPSAVLRMLALETISLDKCAELGPWERSDLNDNIFCGHDPRRKTCFGDNGGPVIAHNKLVGVVSWGSGKCTDDNAPSIYTKVSEYSQWINGILCVEQTDANRPSFVQADT